MASCMSSSVVQVAAWLWIFGALGCASAWRSEGELPLESTFSVFVGKFCFDYGMGDGLRQIVGSVNMSFHGQLLQTHYPAKASSDPGGLYLLLFDDEATHWKALDRGKDLATWCGNQGQLRDVTSLMVSLKGSHEDTSHFVNIREGIRPRFWYFAFLACGVPVRERSYTFHAVNGVGVDQEFSLDHKGLFNAHAVFAVLFLVTGLLVRRASGRTLGNGMPLHQHPHMKLLMFGYAASTAADCFFLLHEFCYRQDGFGSMRIRFLGALSGIIANSTVFLISILCSVGWGVSSARLPSKHFFLGLVCTVGALSAWCEMHVNLTADSSTKLYGYQSTLGVVAMVLKIFMFCWFAFQVRVIHESTLLHKQRRFYKWLGVGVSVWSLNVPVVVLLAFNVVPWFRYRCVTIAELVARYLGQALLAWLFCGPLSPFGTENMFLNVGAEDVDRAAELGQM